MCTHAFFLFSLSPAIYSLSSSYPELFLCSASSLACPSVTKPDISVGRHCILSCLSSYSGSSIAENFDVISFPTTWICTRNALRKECSTPCSKCDGKQGVRWKILYEMPQCFYTGKIKKMWVLYFFIWIFSYKSQILELICINKSSCW